MAKREAALAQANAAKAAAKAAATTGASAPSQGKAPRSWQAAEHDDVTSNFICQIRPLVVQRRSWKALCVTMAEVVRNRKREGLRAAATVSIAFDEKAPRKLLMFKCDTPELPTRSCLDADRTRAWQEHGHAHRLRAKPRPSLSMVPWLSRAEREAREKTRKTTELRV